MKPKIYSQAKGVRNLLANFILRKRVKDKRFTIVSVDCWGSSIYQEMNLPYNTPFVGLFFHAPCYIKLLSNLREYLQSDLSFTSVSKYPTANEDRQKRSDHYPIGLLGDDIEIHFLHYQDEEEARSKWNLRRERMNLENLFVEFSDRNLCTTDHLKEFDRLDFPNKVVFTAQSHPEIRSCVWLNEFAGRPYIDNIYNKTYVYKRRFDMADWLNGGSGKMVFPYNMINKLLEAR